MSLASRPGLRRALSHAALAVALVAAGGPAAAAPPVELEAAPGWESTYGRASAGGVALGDGNGDGLLDLAAGNYASPSDPNDPLVLIYFGDGGGLEEFPSWQAADARHTTDLHWFLEPDGKPALFAVNGGAFAMASAIFRTDGAVLETDPSSFVTPPFGAAGAAVALGDVDGDATVDAFVSYTCISCETTPSLGFLSAGGARPEDPNWVTTRVERFGGIALLDVDGSSVEARRHEAVGDGTRRVFWLPGAPLELRRVVVDGAGPGLVTWDRKSGYVAFATPPPADAAIGFDYEVATAPDLALANAPTDSGAGVIEIYPAGASAPETTATEELGPAGVRHRNMVAADVDLDGDVDLVAGGSLEPSVAVHYNDGGALEATPSWLTDDASTAEGLAVVDLNGDGFPEIIKGEFSGGVKVYRNDEGTFEATPSIDFDTAASIGSMTAGDVDGDGMGDVVVGTAGGPLVIYHGTGTPAPAPTIEAVTPTVVDGVTTELTISGTGFRAPTAVYLGDVRVTDVATEADQLVVTLPADLDGGTYDVFVVNPGLQAAALADGVTIGGGGDDGGGCGCRTGGGGAPASAPLVFAAVVLALRRRRRRRG